MEAGQSVFLKLCFLGKYSVKINMECCIKFVVFMPNL